MVDMEDERTVPKEDGEKFTKQFTNCGFMEASAKERINVDEAFETVVRRIIAKQEGSGGGEPTKGKCIIS